MSGRDLVADAASLRDIIRYDWAYAGRMDRLHAVATATYDPVEWAAIDATMACGWQVRMAWIPGLFSRSTAPRCHRCCDRTGLPRGVGSPKNDDTCRKLLRLDEEVQS